jgi:hypothetical protein
MRFDFGDEVRAPNQACLQRRTRERPCGFQIRRGGQNDEKSFSGFHAAFFKV